MWVLADVPEHDLGFIRLGQPVTVKVRSAPNRAYAGHVDLIYPNVNEATRSARVRIQLPNPDGALLADMYADVAIATGTPDPVVAVPEDDADALRLFCGSGLVLRGSKARHPP